jgi:ribose transport system permease protein
MSTIAGVVIGGASLMGGEGTVVMTVFGVCYHRCDRQHHESDKPCVYPQMVVKAALLSWHAAQEPEQQEASLRNIRRS